MKPIALVAVLPLLLAAGPALRSSPELGQAEGRCRSGESGPALMVEAVGLKDRSGRLKAEIYPPNEKDFLADDNVLVSAGKTFRRVIIPTPRAGAAMICIRIPGPGTYSLLVHHDTNANHKFDYKIDGIGFASNPKLGWSKPKASATRVVVRSGGVSKVSVVMNYKIGLGVGPIKK